MSGFIAAKKPCIVFTLRHLRIAVVSLLLSVAVNASAQGILTGARTGTIQALRQSEGYITVSGRNYGFDNEITVVSLRGSVVDSAILDGGMVIRYTVDANSTLVQIEILGPAAKLEELDNN